MSKKTNSAVKILMALFAVGASAQASAQQSIQTPVWAPAGGSIELRRGDLFHSGDGRFELRFQSDGNLVLYQGSSALWSSGTTPIYQQGPGPVTFINHACLVRFQSDGNLVIYGRQGVVGALHPCLNESAPLGVAWSSNTWQHPNSKFDVQNDGNVVIVNTSNRPVWSTRTCCR